MRHREARRTAGPLPRRASPETPHPTAAKAASASDMMRFFDLHHTVSEDEIDAQGHVHNLRYLQWTLWAADAHTAATGWDSQSALRDGFGWVVRDHEVTYRAAALRGDRVVVRTWVRDLAAFASWRKYVICRPADRTVLTRVQTRWVFVDLNRHQVVAIPDPVKSTLVVQPQPPPLPWE